MTALPEPIAWPEDLTWVLKALKRTTFQNFKETEMQAGNIRRRPLHPPMEGFSGSVVLNEKDWNALNRLIQSAQISEIIAPDTRQPVKVKFRDEPFVETKSFKIGGPTTRTVRIQLVVQ
jgi:hypothetical protein